MVSISRPRIYWLICGLMVLISLPGRVANLGQSLWLDEAWVVNSVMAPTLRETFHFDRWVQSTPPLFLAMTRAVTLFAGYSEPALRIVPLLAAFASLAILAVVLRRLFSPPVAWLGFAMSVCNYWVMKYGQQTKQYTADLLVACLMIAVLERVVRDGRDRTGDVRVGLLGCVSTFLSFTSVFWFPSCVIAVFLPNPAPVGSSHASTGGRHYGSAIGLALLLAAGLGLNYLAFVRPNMAPGLFRMWSGSFLDVGRPGASLYGLQQNVGELLTTLSFPLANYVVWLVDATLAFGALRAVRGSLRGDRDALTILLAGVLPIVTAIVVSTVRLYPLLTYPRFLLWAVPSAVVLFCHALAPAVQSLSRLSASISNRVVSASVALLCLAVVTLSQFVVFAFPRPTEENREAAEFIRSNARGSDLVFVHGGMNEQFRYYQRALSWNPGSVYFGSTDWPCCALNIEKRTSSPGARDFLDDVNQAAALLTETQTLWLLLPSAAPGHWSLALAPQISALDQALEHRGCLQQHKRIFDQTLVLAFSCG